MTNRVDSIFDPEAYSEFARLPLGEEDIDALYAQWVYRVVEQYKLPEFAATADYEAGGEQCEALADALMADCEETLSVVWRSSTLATGNGMAIGHADAEFNIAPWMRSLREYWDDKPQYLALYRWSEFWLDMLAYEMGILTPERMLELRRELISTTIREVKKFSADGYAEWKEIHFPLAQTWTDDTSILDCYQQCRGWIKEASDIQAKAG